MIWQRAGTTPKGAPSERLHHAGSGDGQAVQFLGVSLIPAAKLQM
jgi:hypothetical protein